MQQGAPMQASLRTAQRYTQWLGWLSLLWLVAAHADKVSATAIEISDEFLEYLGSMESDDDNWTDFTADAVAARSSSSAANSTAAMARPAPASRSSSSSVVSKAGK